MTGVLIFVVGPSGVGKDSLIEGAKGTLSGDARFHFLKRDITRPIEAGGEDHSPVSLEVFTQKLNAGDYALHWGAHSLRYGIPKSELECLERGQSVIANGSRSVLKEARENFEHLAIVSITACEELIRERLIARGRESLADIEKRLARANAFEVSGSDVYTLTNDTALESGVAKFSEYLCHIHDRL